MGDGKYIYIYPIVIVPVVLSRGVVLGLALDSALMTPVRVVSVPRGLGWTFKELKYSDSDHSKLILKLMSA